MFVDQKGAGPFKKMNGIKQNFLNRWGFFILTDSKLNFQLDVLFLRRIMKKFYLMQMY
ncbi:MULTISPECIES: hypothetical protein [Bacillus cereus group]|uniref:hypothetical protein n=1 Tax=Bacillus cereus group TaxID=86661 RepID=UPI001F57C3BD|nr:hypothetical protein [Bacillus cereus group sp. BfR-BA-01522]